ncbi:MAG: hypothetical protein KDD22_07045, partial [Bdellovibrionales bacterium]|nr:hypothetical protein [Bdellovibrionales bacterium]
MLVFCSIVSRSLWGYSLGYESERKPYLKDLNLLAIDDDQLVLQGLRRSVPAEWHVNEAHRLEEANLEKAYHAAFIDIHLQKGSSKKHGLDIISRLAELKPHLEIVAMSGDLNRETMEK